MPHSTYSLRIGIIGVAHHHIDSYLTLLRTFTGVTLIGMSEDNPTLAKAYHDKYALTVYKTAQHLLAEHPHAVIICSENNAHSSHVHAAATAGVHILCEKPLATNTDDAKSMVAQCHKAGVILMPALPMRFNQAIVQTHDLIHSNTVGVIHGGSSTNQGQIPYRHRMWFVDPAAAGGGAIMDHTIHVVDILRWLMDSEVTQVGAFANSIMQPIPIAVETGALMMLRFANGASFSLDASWSRPQKYPTWGGLTIRIVTSAGVVEIDAFSQKNTLYGDAHHHVRDNFWGQNADSDMLVDFINAVRNSRTPQVRAEDGLAAQQVIDAAYRSIAAQSSVKV